MKFKGFTPGMTDALVENRLKNSRDWYNAHKAQFKKEIYEPFYALIEDMSEQMLALDSRMYLIPRFCVSRIVRDTRRSKDKSTLYRANLWCFFRRYPKTEPNAPFFYFEFYPDRYRYGFFYGPWETAALDAYRQTVLNDPDGLREALSHIRFAAPELETFKKKYHNTAPADLDAFYAAKTIHFGRTFTDMSGLYDASFMEPMRCDFAECEALYRYLVEIRPTLSEESETYIPTNTNKPEW